MRRQQAQTCCGQQLASSCGAIAWKLWYQQRTDRWAQVNRNSGRHWQAWAGVLAASRRCGTQVHKPVHRRERLMAPACTKLALRH